MVKLEILGDTRIHIISTTKLMRITSASLNRAVDAGITACSRSIRTKYNITAGAIRKAIRITISGLTGSEASLIIDARSISFKYFGARQRKYGVTLRILKAGQSTFVRHAFIGGWIPIRMKGGGFAIRYVGELLGGHVFIREGTSRLPIKKLTTNSVVIGKLFTHPNHFPAFESRVVEVFNRDFKRLLKMAAGV